MTSNEGKQAMRGEMVPHRFQRAPLGRRGAAFAIDFGVVSVLSCLGGSTLYIFLFILIWLGLRVFLVEKNRGQSLGRWALDLRVVDASTGSTPGLLELFKREAIAGLGSLLLLVGLVSLSPTNGTVLVSCLPLLADGVVALLDSENRQAFHDRIPHTLVVQTRRGFSLDLKLKSLFAKANRRMK
jgi:uncharacterized RDD family membrane protein YckC